MFRMILGAGTLLCSCLLWAETPRQSREIQFIEVNQNYRVAIDTDPAWSWSVDKGTSAVIFTAHSPDQYYPPTDISISFYPTLKISSNPEDIRASALEAFKTTATRFQAKDRDSGTTPQPFTFKRWHGYRQSFLIDHLGVEQSMAQYVGRTPQGRVFSLTAITQAHKLEHIRHAIDRIGNSLSLVRQ